MLVETAFVSSLGAVTVFLGDPEVGEFGHDVALLIKAAFEDGTVYDGCFGASVGVSWVGSLVG